MGTSHIALFQSVDITVERYERVLESTAAEGASAGDSTFASDADSARGSGELRTVCGRKALRLSAFCEGDTMLTPGGCWLRWACAAKALAQELSAARIAA